MQCTAEARTCTMDSVAAVTGSEKSPPGGDTAPTTVTEPSRSGLDDAAGARGGGGGKEEIQMERSTVRAASKRMDIRVSV